jgi:long-chain acyl-CoA synthetase
MVISPETSNLIDIRRFAEMNIEVLILNDRRGAYEIKGDQPLWDLNTLPSGNHYVPFQGASVDDIMTIVYTSGTTASPQGVVHSIADMFGNAALFNRTLGIGSENRFYGVLAMTYLGGYYNLLMLPFTAGASVVLANAFDARSAINFWQPAIENSVNTLWLVPTIISILMEMDRGKAGEKFCREQIKLALVGTAPLPVALRHKFENRYGLTLYENYGLSETFFISTNSPFAPVIDGSVGKCLPGIQVMTTDQDGQPLNYGEEGEIRVTTPYLMNGYYNPASPEPHLDAPGGWFPTGDLGICSPTGEVYITGRKKDLIIKGGLNVSPAAIENVIYQYADVAECAVVGIPHTIYGEDIAVVVRLANGVDFEEVRSDLWDMCRQELSSPRKPAHILEIDNFPHSSTGKIQKHKVQELIVRKLGLRKPEKTGTLEAVRPDSPTSMPSHVIRTINRPSPSLIEELGNFPTTIVSDCMNRLGAMDGLVHSMVRGRLLCGPAATVEEVEGGNLMSHVALELIQPGDVLVIDAKGCTTRSCLGGLQVFMAKQRGAAGVVVFGAIRDLDEIDKFGLPVYAIGTSPAGPLKGWGGYVNHPISCAGVVVNPGDIILADDDGVVVVPSQVAPQLPDLCRSRLTLEESWFKRVEAGESTLEVVGLKQRIKDLKILFKH